MIPILDHQHHAQQSKCEQIHWDEWPGITVSIAERVRADNLRLRPQNEPTGQRDDGTSEVYAGPAATVVDQCGEFYKERLHRPGVQAVYLAAVQVKRRQGCQVQVRAR